MVVRETGSATGPDVAPPGTINSPSTVPVDTQQPSASWERVPAEHHVSVRVLSCVDEALLRAFAVEVWPGLASVSAQMARSDLIEHFVANHLEMPQPNSVLDALERLRAGSAETQPRQQPAPNREAPRRSGRNSSGWGEPGTEGTREWWEDRANHRDFLLGLGAHIETRPEYTRGTPEFLCFFPVPGTNTIKLIAEKFQVPSVQLKAGNRAWFAELRNRATLRVDTPLDENFPVALEFDFPSDELLAAIERGEADQQLKLTPDGWWVHPNRRSRIDVEAEQLSQNQLSQDQPPKDDSAEIASLKRKIDELSDKLAEANPGSVAGIMAGGPSHTMHTGAQVGGAVASSMAGVSPAASSQHQALWDAARRVEDSGTPPTAAFAAAPIGQAPAPPGGGEAAASAAAVGDTGKIGKSDFDPHNPSHLFRTENTPDNIRLRLLEQQAQDWAMASGMPQVSYTTFEGYFNAATHLVMVNPSLSNIEKCEVYEANFRRVRHLKALALAAGLSAEQEAEAVRELAFRHSTGSKDALLTPAEDILTAQLKKKQKLALSKEKTALDSKASGSTSGDLSGMLTQLASTLAGMNGGGGGFGNGGRGGGKGGFGGRGGGKGEQTCFYCKKQGHKERDFSGVVTCPDRLAGRPPKN